MSTSGNGKPPKPPKAATGNADEASSKVIRIPDPVTVLDLAGALAQKPFKIIADLMLLGVFTNVQGVVGFQTASEVASKYGLRTEKIG
jgi:hypothetical protein